MENQSDLLLGSSNNLETIEKNKMADEHNSEAISATVKSDQINAISHGQKETDTKNTNNNQINLQNDIFEITETPNTEKPLTFEIFEPKNKPSNRASPQNNVWGNAEPDYTTGFTDLDANNNEIRVNEDSHTRQASNTSTGSSTSGTQMSGNSNGQIGNGLMGSGQGNNFGGPNNGFAHNNTSDNPMMSEFRSDTFETVKNDGFQSKLDFQPKNGGGFSEFKPENGVRGNVKDTSKDLWSMPKAEVRANDSEFKMSSWGNMNEKADNSVKDRQHRQPHPSNGSGSSSGSNGYQSGQHSFQNQGQNNFQPQQQPQQNTQQQPQQHQQNGYGKFEAYGKNDAYPRNENVGKTEFYGKNDGFGKNENYGRNDYAKTDYHAKYDGYKTDGYKNPEPGYKNEHGYKQDGAYGKIEYGQDRYYNGRNNNNNHDGYNSQDRGGIYPAPYQQQGGYEEYGEEAFSYRETQFDSRRTLYVGQLHPIINEVQLKECFGLFGEVVSCKIHKEPQHKSYCFIEFRTKECACAAKVAMNMRKLHDVPIEVNWANTNSTLYNKKKLLPQDKFGVFIGDIPPEMTNDELYKLFDKSFTHVVDARIVVEPLSQKSKQYGFVNFTVKQSAERAIKEWNNTFEIEGRPIRLGWADRSQRNIPTKTYDEICRLPNFTGTNTTVYIGGVKEGVSEDKLKQIFSEFGDMKEVRLFTEKGYAFISFIKHQSAQESIRHKTGTQIEGHTIRCAWGRENNGPPDGSDPLGDMNDITKCFEDMDAHEGKKTQTQNSPLGNFTGEMSESLVGNQFRNDYNNNNMTGDFSQNNFNSRSSPNGTDSWMKLTESTKSDMVFNTNIWSNTESGVQN